MGTSPGAAGAAATHAQRAAAAPWQLLLPRGWAARGGRAGRAGRGGLRGARLHTPARTRETSRSRPAAGAKVKGTPWARSFLSEKMTPACGFQGGLLREDRDCASGLGERVRMGSLRRAFENDQICGTFALKKIIISA